MIQANELRIGNLVSQKYMNTKGDGSYLAVNSIYEEDFSWIIEYPDNYEPIPLTEEWLLKFGFNEETKAILFSKDAACGRISLYIDQQDGILLALENPDSIAQIPGVKFKTYNYPGIPIKHVHQLQNLYFALTGEELRIME